MRGVDFVIPTAAGTPIKVARLEDIVAINRLVVQEFNHSLSLKKRRNHLNENDSGGKEKNLFGLNAIGIFDNIGISRKIPMPNMKNKLISRNIDLLLLAKFSILSLYFNH